MLRSDGGGARGGEGESDSVEVDMEAKALIDPSLELAVWAANLIDCLKHLSIFCQSVLPEFD